MINILRQICFSACPLCWSTRRPKSSSSRCKAESRSCKTAEVWPPAANSLWQNISGSTSIVDGCKARRRLWPCIVFWCLWAAWPPWPPPYWFCPLSVPTPTSQRVPQRRAFPFCGTDWTSVPCTSIRYCWGHRNYQGGWACKDCHTWSGSSIRSWRSWLDSASAHCISISIPQSVDSLVQNCEKVVGAVAQLMVFFEFSL